METVVYNRFNAPKGKKVCSGKAIYEYEYYDKKQKKIVVEKKNIFEKTQSCVGQTDYKKRIALGEEFLSGAMVGDVIRDYTAIPTDKVDVIDFINFVSGMDETQIANFIQQATAPNSEGTQEVQVNSEVSQEVSQEQPASGENNTGGSL